MGLFNLTRKHSLQLLMYVFFFLIIIKIIFQVQIKDLSLDSTVKFLLAQQNSSDGSFQFVTQSPTLQEINPNQYGIGLTISNPNQRQVSTAVQSSSSTEAAVRIGQYQLLVPQLKRNESSLQVDPCILKR